MADWSWVLGHERRIDPALFAVPLVEGCWIDGVLTAQICNRRCVLPLFENGDDLLFMEISAALLRENFTCEPGYFFGGIGASLRPGPRVQFPDLSVPD